MTKYKIKPDDLRDAIVAGLVFLAILVYVVEKHRREKGCTSCQQQQNLDDLLMAADAAETHSHMSQQSLTAEQIRRGAI